MSHKKKKPIKIAPGSGGQNPCWPGDEKPITPKNEPPDTKVPFVR